MDRYHDLLLEEGQDSKGLSWHRHRLDLQANLENLRKTVERGRVPARESEDLIAMAQLNLDRVWALTQDINATAEQLGLSPIPPKVINLSKTSKDGKA